MSTNPSVSATSPGPRVPGPPAAEHADPWESQHLCSCRAGGAGAGSEPAGPPHPPPLAASARPASSESSEWKERVSASSHVLGNQMIRQKGVPPPLADAHAAPECSTRALARTRHALPLPPGAVRTQGRSGGGAIPAPGRPQLGARSPSRAESRRFGEGSCRCGPGGPVNETWVDAIGREGVVTGQGGEAAPGHPRPASGPELRARGPKTGRRIKRKCPHCSP